MLIRKLQMLIFVCMCLLSCEDSSLQSPNGKISVAYHAEEGFKLTYQDKGNEVDVVNIPTFGLGTTDSCTCFRLISQTQTSSIVDDYEMLTGKRKHCHNEANERTYRFEDEKGIQLELTFRAYNDGVAFRYHIPEDQSDVKVTSEYTAFAFAPGIKRWTQQFTVGYEGFYHPNTDGVASNSTGNWNLPALFQPSEETFALLTEANILHGNSGAYLNNKSESSAYQIKLSDKELLCSPGWHSPWRVVIMGTLADIVESTLVTDVSEPCKVEDTSWIKPGLVSWIYWAYNHGSKDYQIVKKYIDFAADYGLPYVLIDWEWDVMGNGGTLQDALNLCKEKKVAPLLWYNSSTAWLDPTPLYRLNTPEDREKEFKWLKEIGVQGVKIDFFGADSIKTMNYYMDILEDAAKHKLLVNFHGAAIPRGWQRTYPHFMSSEAVYGAEWYNNNGTLTHQAAWHNCTLPFTRNVIGPMDYTPCTFTDSQHPHLTTNAHELALLIAFESGLQHLADRPEGYGQQPEAVQEFIKKLPASWDDTRFVSGYPSEEVVLARRSGDCWFVAGLNGTDQVKDIQLDWSFLDDRSYSLKLFQDKALDEATWHIGEHKGMPDTFVKELQLQPRGGFVAVIK